MLVLSFAEDCLHHDVEDLVVDLEALHILWFETFLAEQLTISDKHFSQLRDFHLNVVLCDLIQN